MCFLDKSLQSATCFSVYKAKSFNVFPINTFTILLICYRLNVIKLSLLNVGIKFVLIHNNTEYSCVIFVK